MKKITLMLTLLAFAFLSNAATKFQASATIWKVYSSGDSVVINQGTVGAGSIVQNSWTVSRPFTVSVSGKIMIVSGTISDVVKGNAFPGTTALVLNFGTDSITDGNNNPFANVLACKAYLNRQAFTDYAKFALDTIGQTANARPCAVYQWNIINSNSVPVYVKLYNTATPTKASTPVATLFIPANGTVFNGNTGSPNYNFSTALGIRCSTGPAIADNGEPTTTTANQVIVYLRSK